MRNMWIGKKIRFGFYARLKRNDNELIKKISLLDILAFHSIKKSRRVFNRLLTTNLNVHSQNDEPPEICVIEGVFAENLTPTQPMPPTEELEEKFAELVEELDLTEANKTQMMSLPSAKKWQIYCSRKIPVDPSDAVDGNSPSYQSNQEKTPSFYVDKLREISIQLKVPSDDSPKHNEIQSKIEQHTKLCDALKTALRTSAHSFVLKFIELQGLPALLNLLEAITDVSVANSPLHTSLIGCIKALMNNSVSF
jgi:dishevelled associated activator of morphogenesis